MSHGGHAVSEVTAATPFPKSRRQRRSRSHGGVAFPKSRRLARAPRAGDETAAPRDSVARRMRAACALGDRNPVGLEHSWVRETSDACQCGRLVALVQEGAKPRAIGGSRTLVDVEDLRVPMQSSCGAFARQERGRHPPTQVCAHSRLDTRS